MSGSRTLPVAGQFSRRDFCSMAGCALIGAGLVSCTADGRSIGTGSTGDLGQGGGGHGADGGRLPDGSVAGGADAAVQAACDPGMHDSGVRVAQLSVGSARRVGDYLVVRDSGGIYAISIVCTHAGCAVQYEPAARDFYCPCHGATFDQNGAAVSGPVFQPLVQFSSCVLGNGNVGVDTNRVVPGGTRIQPA